MASAAVIVGEERYVFDTDFYDTQADIIRYYRITFYPGDSTIEMVSETLFFRTNDIFHAKKLHNLCL
jgi:hypothetical protein